MTKTTRTLGLALALLATAAVPTSCDMMHEETDYCPYGLYLTFKYDYNLQRADMFNDHVGSLTLYIFDEQERLVSIREESNTATATPLANPAYAMHVTGLAPGRYKFIALAGQKPYADMLASGRARFVRADMGAGDPMRQLDVRLDRVAAGNGIYNIDNRSLPLDTLWHGMETGGFEVSATRPTYGTISLVRDTKKINVTLRELDNPAEMDIANYDLRITDRNSHILWDNSLDESDAVVYTPHATWNTTDRTDAPSADGTATEAPGRIGHADFMTSRIIFHDDPADDGRLTVTNRLTGVEVATINLPDVLSRLRTSEDIHRYSEQEFLDRGYDYQIDIFLRGDRLAYINISISVLGWSKRVQYEELGL